MTDSLSDLSLNLLPSGLAVFLKRSRLGMVTVWFQVTITGVGVKGLELQPVTISCTQGTRAGTELVDPSGKMDRITHPSTFL